MKQNEKDAKRDVIKKCDLKQNEKGAKRDGCCFVALRPKSLAMVIAGRSVHLTTLFPGQA